MDKLSFKVLAVSGMMYAFVSISILLSMYLYTLGIGYYHWLMKDTLLVCLGATLEILIILLFKFQYRQKETMPK